MSRRWRGKRRPRPPWPRRPTGILPRRATGGLCAFLAQARYALGRFSEAADVAQVAASSAIAVERALGLGVLARVRAREGDTAGAEELIGEAVGIVEATDFLFDRGTVQLDLAEVMRLMHRDDEARVALGRALGMFEEKGDLVSAARTRALREGR